MKRIEMLGYPCTGKSYFIEHIHNDDSYVKSRANVDFTIKNIFALIFFIIQRPKLLKLFLLFRFVSFSNFKTQFLSTIRFFFRIRQLHWDIKYDSKNIVDEGIAQATWSLLLLPSLRWSDSELDKYLNEIVLNNWLKCSMKVYYAEVDFDEYKSRIINRARKHYYTEAIINSDKIISENGVRVMQLIKKYCAEKYELVEIKL